MVRIKFFLAVSVRAKLLACFPALTLFFSMVYNELKTEKALAKPDGCANALCT